MDRRLTDPEYVRIWRRTHSPGDFSAVPRYDWSEFVVNRLACEVEKQKEYRRSPFVCPGQLCAQRIRLLRTALFFLEVTPPCPLDSQPLSTTPVQALRQLYRSECGAEQDYAQAAESCPDPALQRVFSQCARLSHRGAELLWQAVRL